MHRYWAVQWASRLRTLLNLMRSAAGEPDCPGIIYLSLLLHYVDQECKAERQTARPRNETVEQICAYLAANYQQKFSLTDVAARFYLSPYYLSRLFRRVTGQSIVDYINGRRIEAAQHLLETTDLNISVIIRFLLVERSTDCGQRSRGRSGSCRLAQQGGKLFRRNLGGAHHLIHLGSFCFLNPSFKAFNAFCLYSFTLR